MVYVYNYNDIVHFLWLIRAHTSAHPSRAHTEQTSERTCVDEENPSSFEPGRVRVHLGQHARRRLARVDGVKDHSSPQRHVSHEVCGEVTTTVRNRHE